MLHIIYMSRNSLQFWIRYKEIFWKFSMKLQYTTMVFYCTEFSLTSRIKVIYLRILCWCRWKKSVPIYWWKKCVQVQKIWWNTGIYCIKTPCDSPSFFFFEWDYISLSVSHSDGSCILGRFQSDVSSSIPNKVYHIVMDNFVNLQDIS